MPDARRLFGTDAEQQVADHLRQQGYRILAHQWKSRYGEIDLVCQDGSEIVFVEVKARRFGTYGFPEESVLPSKLRKIVQTAQVYLQSLPDEPLWRIDVVAVETDANRVLTHLKRVDIPEGI